MLGPRPQDDSRAAEENGTGRRDPPAVREPAGREKEVCEVCGARMFGLHCKLVCSRCGFRRDCSDP
ncbi:hypothetical protein RxyAA322_14730 [Rubrobacter xylanophilus]|uniref:Uncharacterized protein n=1 Tax=Rubrobacter xylanophilus TaxID=49319 RepID=A0A510HI27_9ACTN|nr:hypothetical protein [Rubrobacter xylanophilus]BBL79619.1 hypothetical protein RxyAA322_14730 [Rubrobacter xylanophilus]